MAEASTTKQETDTEGVHEIADTENVSGGGAVAISGFLLQTLAALGRILTAKPRFEEITLEPVRGQNGKIDKFDFLWTDCEGTKFAEQVKSSKNGFTRAKVTTWVNEMLTQRTVERCTLVLAGYPAIERGHPLHDEERISNVQIRFTTSQIDDQTKIICYDLVDFLKDEELNPSTAEARMAIIDRLVTNLLKLSTKSATLKHDEFREMLRVWTKTDEASADIDSTALAAAYTRAECEVNRLLLEHPCIGSLLRDAEADLVQRESEDHPWKLTEVVCKHSIDICKALKSIKAVLPHFGGQGTQWHRLQDVIGWLITLSVDRGWVLKQRHSQSHARFPGQSETVPFNKDRSANLLPVVTAALSTGPVQLDRLYGTENPRHLKKDPPQVGRSIGDADKMRELKSHLLEGILGPVRYNKALKAEVDEQFEFAISAAAYEALEKGDPFFATSEAYLKLYDRIKELGLDHFLVIGPDASSRPKQVISEPVFLFNHAFEIFEFIKTKLSPLP